MRHSCQRSLAPTCSVRALPPARPDAKGAQKLAGRNAPHCLAPRFVLIRARTWRLRVSVCSQVPTVCVTVCVQGPCLIGLIGRPAPPWQTYHHLAARAADGGSERIPCPLDNSHSIYAHDVKRHLKICPKAKEAAIESALPCFRRDVDVSVRASVCRASRRESRRSGRHSSRRISHRYRHRRQPPLLPPPPLLTAATTTCRFSIASARLPPPPPPPLQLAQQLLFCSPAPPPV